MRVKHEGIIIPLIVTEELTFTTVPPDTIWVTGVTAPILRELGIEVQSILNRSFGWFYLIDESDLEDYLRRLKLPRLHWER